MQASVRQSRAPNRHILRAVREVRRGRPQSSPGRDRPCPDKAGPRRRASATPGGRVNGQTRRALHGTRTNKTPSQEHEQFVAPGCMYVAAVTDLHTPSGHSDRARTERPRLAPTPAPSRRAGNGGDGRAHRPTSATLMARTRCRPHSRNRHRDGRAHRSASRAGSSRFRRSRHEPRTRAAAVVAPWRWLRRWRAGRRAGRGRGWHGECHSPSPRGHGLASGHATLAAFVTLAVKGSHPAGSPERFRLVHADRRATGRARFSPSRSGDRGTRRVCGCAGRARRRHR